MFLRALLVLIMPRTILISQRVKMRLILLLVFTPSKCKDKDGTVLVADGTRITASVAACEEVQMEGDTQLLEVTRDLSVTVRCGHW